MLRGNRGWLPWNKLVPQCIHACSVAHSCPALWDPLDCSLTGSSIHGIFQASILEWIAISFSGDLPNPGIEPVSPDSPALQADSLPLSHLGSWYLDNNILKMLLDDENLSKLIVAMVTPLCEYDIIDSFQWVNYISIFLGRSPGERNAYPLQYSGLENSMGYIVDRAAKSRTQLSNFHFKLF